MPTPPISRGDAERTIREIERALREGHRPPGITGRGLGAVSQAALRLGVPSGTLYNRLRAIEARYGLAPNWSLYNEPNKIGSETDSLSIIRDNAWARRRIEQLEAEIARMKADASHPDAIAHALGLVREHKIDPPDWVLGPHRSDDTPGVPVCLWSDWHIGETVDPAQTYGMNAFNEHVADHRIKSLVERTIHLACDRMVNPRYPGIVVWLGGDMVSGWLHQELISTDWCPPTKAVAWCVSRLRLALIHLRDRFGRVLVICSPGNHGRITQRPIAKNSAIASYDHIIYSHLVELFRDDGAITVHAAADGEALVQIAGTRFLFMHGHELGVAGGDGIIGALGPIMRGRTKVGRSQATVGREFDVLCIGHYHQPIWQPTAGIIVNGTLKGWDEYARVRRLPYATSSQMLFFVHPTWGPIQPFDVFLQPRAMRKRINFAEVVEE